MIVIAVVVFGLVSYQRLSLNLMPEISYPTLTVRTEYPGTAPEEVETVVSRPVEQALGAERGSTSRAGNWHHPMRGSGNGCVSSSRPS